MLDMLFQYYQNPVKKMPVKITGCPWYSRIYLRGEFYPRDSLAARLAPQRAISITCRYWQTFTWPRTVCCYPPPLNSKPAGAGSERIGGRTRSLAPALHVHDIVLAKTIKVLLSYTAKIEQGALLAFASCYYY